MLRKFFNNADTKFIAIFYVESLLDVLIIASMLFLPGGNLVLKEINIRE